MPAFAYENMATLLTGAVVVGLILFAIYLMVKNRKKGCSYSCSGKDCAACRHNKENR